MQIDKESLGQSWKNPSLSTKNLVLVPPCCLLTRGSLRKVWSATNTVRDPKQPLGAMAPIVESFEGRSICVGHYRSKAVWHESLLLILLLCYLPGPHTLREYVMKDVAP